MRPECEPLLCERLQSEAEIIALFQQIDYMGYNSISAKDFAWYMTRCEGCTRAQVARVTRRRDIDLPTFVRCYKRLFWAQGLAAE